MLMAPVFLRGGLAFDRVGVNVLGTTATSVCRLGVYASDPGQAYPSTLLADWGTVATATAGQKEITIAWTVPTTALYYLAGVMQTATTSMTCATEGVISGIGPHDSVLSPRGVFYDTGIAGALPNPPTLDGANAVAIHIRLRAA
jgi:hypothetical protein